MGVCRVHYGAKLISTTEVVVAMGQGAAALDPDQPDSDAVHAQFDRVVDAVSEKLPVVADHLEYARADTLVFTPDARVRMTQSALLPGPRGPPQGPVACPHRAHREFVQIDIAGIRAHRQRRRSSRVT